MRIEYGHTYSLAEHTLLYPDVERVAADMYCNIIRLEVHVQRPWTPSDTWNNLDYVVADDMKYVVCATVIVIFLEYCIFFFWHHNPT